MDKFIQVYNITPQEFREEILESLREEINSLKENLQPKTPTEFLTRKEVSEMLKVDLSTIHNWCKSNKLKPLGIGSRVYFRRSDVVNSIVEL